MRARVWRFWVVVGFFALINAAALLWMRGELAEARGARARVLVALPDHDVDSADRFALIFDSPVASPYAVGRPLDSPPFRLTPRPPGQWVWATRDQLEYRLEKPLAPGCLYRIDVSDAFALQTGYRLAGKTSFEFASRRLKLEDCALDAADNEWLTFTLVFNQPVDARAALRNLAVRPASAAADPVVAGSGEDLGDEVNVVPMKGGSAESLTFQVRRSPNCRRLRITVKGSLTGAGAALALGHDETRDLTVPRSFVLLRGSVDTPGLDDDLTVWLHFSRRPDRHQKLPEVQVDPPVAHLQCRWSYRGLGVEGPFQSGQRYRVQVSSSLISQDGALLGGANETFVEIPDRAPTLRLTYTKGILSPDGNLALGLEAVNVDAVEVSAARVYENNLVSHVHGDGPQRTARELPDKTVSLEAARNEPTRISLPLREIFDEPSGIYRVTVRAADNYWVSSRALVTVSDLALTVKREREGVLVWVTSVRTAQPLGGVTLRAHSIKNQLLAEAVTGADGTARLPVDPDDPAGRLYIVSARLAGDLNYIRPDQRPWMIDGVDTSGRSIPYGYDVMLYTERGAYRPGDTVHLTGIVRGPHGEVPPSFPVSVSVERPDGKQVADLSARPEAGMQGIFQVDWASRADGQTGTYSFEAHLPGATEELGRTQASVEAFVPVRIEVKASSTQEFFAPGEPVLVDVHARYLFDQPAAGLGVTLTGRLHAVVHRSQTYPDYHFGGDLPAKPVKIEPVEGKLDDQGRGRVTVKLPELKAEAMWRADLVASVVEPGGRAVSQTLTTLLDRSGRHVGVRLRGGNVQRVDEMLQLDWVVCTSRDLPAEPGSMELSLARLERDWVIQEVNGWPTWKPRELEVPVMTRTVAGREADESVGTVGFVCPTTGHYRLWLRDLSSGNVARMEFEATAEAANPKVLAVCSPERLDLVLDQPDYREGGKARLLVRSPFPGTLFLTLETDHVVWHDVRAFLDQETLIEVPLTADLRGGAFVTGSVVRPVDPARQNWQPVRAMGITRLTLNHGARQVTPHIEVAGRLAPGEAARVTVQAPAIADPAHPAVVHLWAVDEGILDVTAYRMPDPLAHFLAPRRLGVATADLFAELLPDVRPNLLAHVGGDSDDEGQRIRRGPVATRRRVPAVIWNSVRTLDPEGQARFELMMPEMTGEMRVMALLVDGDHYGKAERRVTLSAPLMVEATWPRFLAPGDHVVVPVKLFNSTEAVSEVRLTLDVEGPIRLIDPPRSVTVQPGLPKRLELVAEATGLGEVTVHLAAEAGEGTPSHGSVKGGPSVENTLRARRTDRLVVRPPSPLHSVARTVTLEAGQSLVLETPPELVARDSRLALSVGASPLVDLRPAVERLIGYPYGCVEQTTSKLWILLAAPQVLPDRGSSGELRAVSLEMLTAGLVRLQRMQTISGGLSYWPGGREANLWGTIYAAWFCVQAKRAGISLKGSFVEDLADYLENQLEKTGGRAPGNATRAFLCHVLAGFGRPQQGWMARLAERIGELDIAARAHLAAAWLESGRRDAALESLQGDTLEQVVTTSTAGRLTSQVAQEAVLLNVLLDLDPRHPWIPGLVARIQNSREHNCWYTTMENAMALAALARYQTLQPLDAAFHGLVLGGGVTRSFNNEKMLSTGFARGVNRIEITSEGTGTVYVSLVAEGPRRKNVFESYDRRIRVRRRWLDRKDDPIDLSSAVTSLHCGDLVQVEVSLEAPALKDHQSVGNVAIVDALPAGLEVENPRLATSATTGSGTPVNAVDRVEFLDDRVLIFTSAHRDKRTFRYTLRAMSEGQFIMPPLQASCMYDTGYASVSGGGRVVVEL